eukprot:SAG11_NODE_37179_length_258_cov_0.647799_1_plen_36_part_01
MISEYTFDPRREFVVVRRRRGGASNALRSVTRQLDA